jgi:hypothetical protein
MVERYNKESSCQSILPCLAWSHVSKPLPEQERQSACNQIPVVMRLCQRIQCRSRYSFLEVALGGFCRATDADCREHDKTLAESNVVTRRPRDA